MMIRLIHRKEPFEPYDPYEIIAKSINEQVYAKNIIKDDYIIKLRLDKKMMIRLIHRKEPFDPYEIIAKSINEQVYAKNIIKDDYIIKLRLDNEIINTVVTWDDDTIVFNDDWYEGQKEIEIIRIIPVSMI